MYMYMYMYMYICNVCNLKWAYQLGKSYQVLPWFSRWLVEFVSKLRRQQLLEFFNSTESETSKSWPPKNTSGILPGECSQQADDFKRCACKLQAYHCESFPASFRIYSYIPEPQICLKNSQGPGMFHQQTNEMLRGVFPSNFFGTSFPTNLGDPPLCLQGPWCCLEALSLSSCCHLPDQKINGQKNKSLLWICPIFFCFHTKKKARKPHWPNKTLMWLMLLISEVDMARFSTTPATIAMKMNETNTSAPCHWIHSCGPTYIFLTCTSECSWFHLTIFVNPYRHIGAQLAIHWDASRLLSKSWRKLGKCPATFHNQLSVNHLLPVKSSSSGILSPWS